MYGGFPHAFVRRAQIMAQQQQQAQIMAQIQRQAAMARQNGLPYYPQQMATNHPGIRNVYTNPTMGQPQRPFMNINTGLGIMSPGDDAERSASDPLSHGSQSRMSPSVQLERLQRQAMGYTRQMGGPVSASPNNPSATFLQQQFAGPAQTPLAQNPFLGAMGISTSPPQANGAPGATSLPAGGYGGGGGQAAAPSAPAPATNGMSTPNLYNLYAEPSPFSATFPGVAGGGEIPSPFSFVAPEMGEGGVGRPRWGEEEEEAEEPLREVTPGKRFDSK
jgi:hypothetical protein